MRDIETIRREWEARREAEGRRRPSVPTVASPAEKTWIWSDLHLSDRNALEAFDRGFADVAAMNREVLAAWRRKVRPDDTIICLATSRTPTSGGSGGCFSTCSSAPASGC